MRKRGKEKVKKRIDKYIGNITYYLREAAKERRKKINENAPIYLQIQTIKSVKINWRSSWGHGKFFNVFGLIYIPDGISENKLK